MPECYTHVHTAMQALMRSGHTVASEPAFMAGACGPDPLYMYGIFRRARTPDLPALAARMHREKTGAFLLALVRYATTSIQQSYALGFITHYTTDCTVSPFIASMSEKGAPYAEANGRYVLATAIDSALYYTIYKTRTVPLHAGTPVLITEDLAQVTILLREAIAEVYGLDIPLLALADAFHDNLFARRLMLSKTGAKRLLLKVLEPKKMPGGAGPLLCRTQPGKRLRRLPDKWTNPFTGDEMALTLPEVTALAEQTGAVCITAAMRNWLGTFSEEKLAAVLGSNNYHTGLPCEENAPPPPKDETEEIKEETAFSAARTDTA